MARLPDQNIWRVILGVLPIPNGQVGKDDRGYIWRWIWPAFIRPRWPSLRTLLHPYQRTGK